MPRFRFKGHTPHNRGLVKRWGDVVKINFPSVGVELRPARGENRFVPGQDIGHEITDERVLRHLRVDPRFEEIVAPGRDDHGR